MAIDTPARIVVLGAGPCGLEAALYARFLGYEVEVYERGDMAEGVRHWGHENMFASFAQSSSSLGLAALAAQDSGYQPPAANAVLTGREWIERYLLPLSQTDLLSDSVHPRTTVLSVSRCTADLPSENRIGDSADDEDDELPEPELRVMLRAEDGRQIECSAHIVIDATGRADAASPSKLLPDGPNCYVLGAKTCGGGEPFPLAEGLAQIRELFAVIGGREDLDLYASMKNPFS